MVCNGQAAVHLVGDVRAAGVCNGCGLLLDLLRAIDGHEDPGRATLLGHSCGNHLHFANGLSDPVLNAIIAACVRERAQYLAVRLLKPGASMAGESSSCQLS